MPLGTATQRAATGTHCRPASTRRRASRRRPSAPSAPAPCAPRRNRAPPRGSRNTRHLRRRTDALHSQSQCTSVADTVEGRKNRVEIMKSEATQETCTLQVLVLSEHIRNVLFAKDRERETRTGGMIAGHEEVVAARVERERVDREHLRDGAHRVLRVRIREIVEANRAVVRAAAAGEQLLRGTRMELERRDHLHAIHVTSDSNPYKSPSSRPVSLLDMDNRFDERTPVWSKRVRARVERSCSSESENVELLELSAICSSAEAAFAYESAGREAPSRNVSGWGATRSVSTTCVSTLVVNDCEGTSGVELQRHCSISRLAPTLMYESSAPLAK